MRAMAAERLAALRLKIAAIDGLKRDDRRRVLPLGIAAVDAALHGGLAVGAVHEVAAAGPLHRGAAFGFALALAGTALAARHADGLLWIETAWAAAETGKPYAPGLAAFGLSPARVLIVRVPRPLDALWVMEEALGCRGLAVLAELTGATDLTATRRLSLAVRRGGGLGLLVHHGASPQASAATTRWHVAAAPSRPDAFGGLGPMAFDLALTRNRHGPCGRWTIVWDPHDRVFLDPTLSFRVAQKPSDRSDRALRRAG